MSLNCFLPPSILLFQKLVNLLPINLALSDKISSGISYPELYTKTKQNETKKPLVGFYLLGLSKDFNCNNYLKKRKNLIILQSEDYYKIRITDGRNLFASY